MISFRACCFADSFLLLLNQKTDLRGEKEH